MASPCNEYVEWLKAVAPIGSWLLVIAGWVIVRRDHDKRELRKEVKALIDSVLGRLDVLEEHARDYFTKTDGGSGIALGASIRAELRAVGVEVKHIQDASKERVEAQECLINLRKAVTAGDFDSAARVPISDADELFDEIRATILEFRSHLQGQFIRFQR